MRTAILILSLSRLHITELHVQEYLHSTTASVHHQTIQVHSQASRQESSGRPTQDTCSWVARLAVFLHTVHARLPSRIWRTTTGLILTAHTTVACLLVGELTDVCLRSSVDSVTDFLLQMCITTRQLLQVRTSELSSSSRTQVSQLRSTHVA